VAAKVEIGQKLEMVDCPPENFTKRETSQLKINPITGI
jgi:hypothetical protein